MPNREIYHSKFSTTKPCPGEIHVCTYQCRCCLALLKYKPLSISLLPLSHQSSDSNFAWSGLSFASTLQGFLIQQKLRCSHFYWPCCTCMRRFRCEAASHHWNYCCEDREQRSFDRAWLIAETLEASHLARMRVIWVRVTGIGTVTLLALLESDCTGVAKKSKDGRCHFLTWLLFWSFTISLACSVSSMMKNKARDGDKTHSLLVRR